MAATLADALIDHDEAAKHAKALFRQGGVEAVQAAGFLVGWRGWGISAGELRSTTYYSFSWAGPWVRAKNGPAEFGSGPGIHALTVALQGWARREDFSHLTGREFHSYQTGSILGLIAGWGETWPYTYGFRCRYAAILGTHAPSYNPDCPYTDFYSRKEINFTIIGVTWDAPPTEAGASLGATDLLAETRRIIPCV